jgi:hypothetical protein
MPRGITLADGSPHPTLPAETTLQQMEVLGWLLGYVLSRGDDAHLSLDFSPAVLKVTGGSVAAVPSPRGAMSRAQHSRRPRVAQVLLHREVTLADVRSVDESLFNSLEYVPQPPSPPPSLACSWHMPCSTQQTHAVGLRVARRNTSWCHSQREIRSKSREKVTSPKKL